MRITKKMIRGMKKFDGFEKAREAFEKKQLPPNELFMVDHGVYKFLPEWEELVFRKYYGKLLMIKKIWWMRNNGYTIITNILYEEKDVVGWMPSLEKALRFALIYANRHNIITNISNGRKGHLFAVYPDGEVLDFEE